MIVRARTEQEVKMSEQVKRFYAPGLDCMYRDNKDAPRELVPMVLGTDHDALHAEAEALRAENGRKQQTIEGMNAEHWKLVQAHAAQAKELEAARGLLERVHDGLEKGHPLLKVGDEIRAFLTATPAPEVQAETLDDRLKQAGMLSVAELLKGAPLDAFIRHAGVHDLSTLLQWAEMRRGECLRMMARYDLGEKDKGDDLYEWIVAHCAVFTELHVNLRAALADQGERQEAVSTDALRNRFSEIEDEVARGKHSAMSCFTAMRTAALYIPQPGPDLRALVSVSTNILGKLQHPTASVNSMDMWKLEDALKPFVDNRQAQQGGSHDT